MADFDSLLLEPFALGNLRIHFRAYAGGGRAGHVFRVRIGKKEYALKMFKFDHPELIVSRFKGTLRRSTFDSFYIECRANGTLIQQGLNGQITPFCHGWLEVPTEGEMQVSRKFGLPPFVWDRPGDRCDEKVRAILFEWIDGKPLTDVVMSSDLADQARRSLQALHRAGISHNDLSASNFIIQEDQEPPNKPKVHLIDLSASITLPHIRFSAQEVEKKQRQDRELLELGFALLARLPINQGRCYVDLSAIDDKASMDDLLADSAFFERFWAPPLPTTYRQQPSPSS